MLTQIRERTQDALLRQELLCGEANFRTLAEAIAAGIFVSQGKRLHYEEGNRRPRNSAAEESEEFSSVISAAWSQRSSLGRT
jgi:hypothetical protein